MSCLKIFALSKHEKIQTNFKNHWSSQDQCRLFLLILIVFDTFMKIILVCKSTYGTISSIYTNQGYSEAVICNFVLFCTVKLLYIRQLNPDRYGVESVS